MSRLDHHVAAVQTKLFLRRFVNALAWTLLAACAVVLLAVVINFFFRIFTDYLPRFPRFWVLIGMGAVCVAISIVYAMIRRPTREAAAAAIDERLRLKEKFSTAIYVRPSNDPFAMAAVIDAERTAEGVNLARQFPIPFPRQAYTAAVLALCALGLASFFTPLSLFGNSSLHAKKPSTEIEQQHAKEEVSRALAAVESMPKSGQNSDEFRKLVAELHELNKASKIADPSKATRRALQALQQVSDQTNKEWDRVKKYAEAQNAMMQSLQPDDPAKGPVGEARKEIAKGNFQAASDKMEEAVKNFDKMTRQQKEDAAKQLEKAANQLKQLAQNPQAQQQIQQQLQQMGANQQQAKQMQNLMQQAAAGNQQAAQQLQQAAKQMAQQMNNGQGPNAQQQQQIQQAMQQMQAQANAQNQANGLAQAAQKMAQAMNAAQQQQGGNGQANPQQQQAMQQAQKGMQQALQNMQGVKQDLRQMAAQQQAAQQAMQQGRQAANGQQQGGAQGGQQQGQGQNGQGQFGQGNPQQQPGNGMGGPAIGAGGVAQKNTVPFGVKMEQSPSQDNEKGRILASYMVKDKADPGVQRMMMRELAKKAVEMQTDEVDSEHASRAAQKVAQEYFRTMAEDAPKAKK